MRYVLVAGLLCLASASWAQVVPPSPTLSVTPTFTLTPSLTPTPSSTPTQTPTLSYTYTPTVTGTRPSTATPTQTPTPTQTGTPTWTLTPSLTPTRCSLSPQFVASNTSDTTTGSTATLGNTLLSYSHAATSIQTNDCQTIVSRFTWNLSADTDVIGNTVTQTGTATHNINFTVNAPTSYTVKVAATRQGDVNRIADSQGNGSGTISAITGSFTGGTLGAGTASYGAIVTLGNGSTSFHAVINDTNSGTFLITGTSGGVDQNHTLKFSWTGNVVSDQREAAIRLGETALNMDDGNGGFTAGVYPGSPSRTQSTDGEVVTLTLQGQTATPSPTAPSPSPTQTLRSTPTAGTPTLCVTAATATPTSTNTPTITNAPTQTGTTTPTFAPVSCTMGSGAQATISARLFVLTLPLTGSQVWRFGNVTSGIRPMAVLSTESHFDCQSSTFSGLPLRLCIRLDPDTPSTGQVDCAVAGGSWTGVDSTEQRDHNTNQATVGGSGSLNTGNPLDPSCVATYPAPDGSARSSCLEGTGAACSGTASTHIGVCNGPLWEDFRDASATGSFLLHELLNLSITPGDDCGTACPSDGTSLQPGEFQLDGWMTSGTSKGVVWQVNNTNLIMGTVGSGSGGAICGQTAGAPNCTTTATGAVIPAGDGVTVSGCLIVPPVSLSTAAAVIAYPVIDYDPTIGDFVATLALECN